MATGTGKTFTAFQIIWRLWKGKAVKRILFLADRNILIDQTKVNDFQPFGGAMTKIENRQADPAYEIYLSLYQAITGTEEAQNIYKQFSPDFFDLVVVDECHRGSAAEDAAWRAVLDYFFRHPPRPHRHAQGNRRRFQHQLTSASRSIPTRCGRASRTATSRPTRSSASTSTRISAGAPRPARPTSWASSSRTASTTAPTSTRRWCWNSATCWWPSASRNCSSATDRYAKTIVFCEDIDHAARMRQALINANADLAAKNPKYVVQITGDNDEGKRELDNFIDPEKPYPVIATTSRLMNTGVDAQTCKLIVLDRTINSMTEFKQIIGRGTRINEDYDKLWFSILDFKRATELFADPAFDGEPVVIYEPSPTSPSRRPTIPAFPRTTRSTSSPSRASPASRASST
jgi:type I restriction enzyme R subunit